MQTHELPLLILWALKLQVKQLLAVVPLQVSQVELQLYAGQTDEFPDRKNIKFDLFKKKSFPYHHRSRSNYIHNYYLKNYMLKLMILK